MLYVVIDNASGAQQRVSPTQLFQRDASEAVLTFPALDAEPSPEVKQWDRATRTYIDAPNFNGGEPVPTTKLTVVQFKARFTETEKDRIEMAQETHPDPMVRARLRRMEKELASVQGQVADRADVGLQRGVAWMTTVQLDGTPLIANLTRAIEIIGADAFDPANLA